MTREPSTDAVEAGSPRPPANWLRLPALLPVYPVVAVAVHVLSQTSTYGVPIMAAFRPMAIAVAVMIAAQLALALALGRHRGSFIAATAVTFLVGAIFSCLALLAIGLARVIMRIRFRASLPSWASTSRALNVVAGALAIVTLVSAWTTETFVVASADGPIRAASPASPNMYFLMLDGYPRSDTLEGWGYDNEPFIAELESLGFEVARQSHSNYTKTWLSLAAMADLRHINSDSFDGPRPPEAVQHRRLSRLFNEGRGWSILREHGYEVVATESAFADLNLYEADRIVGGSPLNAFETDLLRVSPVSRLGIVSDWIIDSYRRRVIDQLASASQVSSDRPVFMWSHILSPHAPAIFDRNGEALSHPCYPVRCPFFQPHARAMGLTEDGLEQLLVGQVSYLNGLVEQAIQEITARDPTAVIVIFSDHGARHQDPNDEYFHNFFAARTPGHPGLFPQDVGMVTTMAVVLNAYLEAGVAVPSGDALFMSDSSPLDLVEWPEP